MRTIRITFESMIVCICHRVSDRDIARAAHEGCASFDDLQVDSGVATCCGKCHDCARQTFELHASAVAAAHHHTAVCFAHAEQATAEPLVFAPEARVAFPG
jgi:bacterioferritin-associated ferredoxin